MTYKVVIPISGGKDSQACLRLALESNSRHEVLGLFCDTKFEHPFTYKHVEWMSEYYGVKIETINAGSVEEQVLKYKRFPSTKVRFCTMNLKIQPSIIFYKKLAVKQLTGFEVWYGMRTGESKVRNKKYNNIVDTELHLPHEIFVRFPKYLSYLGIKIRLPIVDWQDDQVFEYLADEENPLYSHGFSRVGCFPCLAAGDKYKISAFEFDHFGYSQKCKVTQLEREINESVFTRKVGDKYQNNDQGPGCSFCAI